MNYLTNYYKNRCEQLQEHINFLQNLLNEEGDMRQDAEDSEKLNSTYEDPYADPNDKRPEQGTWAWLKNIESIERLPDERLLYGVRSPEVIIIKHKDPEWMDYTKDPTYNPPKDPIQKEIYDKLFKEWYYKQLKIRRSGRPTLA